MIGPETKRMAKCETIRDLLLYEYAKIIADAAIGKRAGILAVERSGRRYWSFVTATYRRLVKGELQPSEIIRKNKLMVSESNRCAYCGAVDQELHWEHIVPLGLGGPDHIDNLVQACAPCNLSKGMRDPIAWYGRRRDEIPRLVMGKLLKLLFEEYERRGFLDSAEYPPGEGLRTSRLISIFQRDPTMASRDGFGARENSR